MLVVLPETTRHQLIHRAGANVRLPLGRDPREEQLQPQRGMNPYVNSRDREQGDGSRVQRPTGIHWRYGLSSCFGDAGTCFFSSFCPCMSYANNKKRLDYLQDQGSGDPEHGCVCNSDCCFHFGLTVCCGLGWVLQLSTRGALRAHRHIEGNQCNDCLAAFFCTPCELTQESRELGYEENSQNFSMGFT
ncbi:PLAC8-domain-containing protein [Leucogyrophana mollusca]|uniref:PLAC8-domain-containing protein n=1 Tax=Leucogyrophana mollusca TaxID=85980 RepID=A0ACB8BWF9_9AGAM|nr:PLAC8-domain-containing protein [Leucogyrophana mollusca]